MGNQKINLEGLPTKPEEIDLRFLTRIIQGDTYNGGDSPYDGLECVTIFYGDRVVYQKRARYDEGSCVGRDKKGNILYVHMYNAAMSFKELYKATMLSHFLVEPEVYITKKSMEILKDHPQFKDLVEQTGMKLKKAKKDDYFLVKISKFAE